MWFKVENKRTSVGQKFIVRCNSEIGGRAVVEERPANGTTAARKTAEILATSLNVTATVYGADADGEFVYGVYEASNGAAAATSAVIKKLYAESVTASLAFKDQLLAETPEDTIKGSPHRRHSPMRLSASTWRSRPASRLFSTLFAFCGASDPSTISLPADDATIALLTQKLSDLPGWMWLSELTGLGSAERGVVVPSMRPSKVMLNIDGELQVIRPRTVFRGTVPESAAHFMLVVQKDAAQSSAAASEFFLARRMKLLTSRWFEGCSRNRIHSRTELCSSTGLRTIRSRMSERSWNDIIPHQQARTELDFIAASIRNRDMLKTEGLSIKRGLLLSGPPGDGKSTAIECFVNDIAGEATVIIVEAIDHMRAVYHLAQMLSPAVVILEDLDLITKSRQNPYSYGMSKDDVTGELLQVLSGGSAYADIVTIATTNHLEAIDEALASEPDGSMPMSAWDIQMTPTNSGFSIFISTVSASTTT